MKKQKYREPNYWPFWKTLFSKVSLGYLLLQMGLMRQHRRILMRDIKALKAKKFMLRREINQNPFMD